MSVEAVWLKQNPDVRGYTNAFKCSDCGMTVTINLFTRECEYPYCPFCKAEMIETEEEIDGNAD